MNIRNLPSILQYIGLPPTTVVVGGPADDHWCIQQHEDGTWEVYFFDRGTKIKQTILPNEYSACMYLFGELAYEQVMSMQLVVAGQ